MVVRRFLRLIFLSISFFLFFEEYHRSSSTTEKSFLIFKSYISSACAQDKTDPENLPPTSSIRHVWANEGGDKVTRDELRASKDPRSVFNGLWDGGTIGIFGARNEVVGFNLILEAPEAAADNVTIAFDTLRGPDDAAIASVSTAGEGVLRWVDRNIELFYIRYLEIKGLSTDLFYEDYDERHIPERFRRPWTGEGEGAGTWEDRPDHNKLYPEIAVPLELISGFDIAAGENQSVWVDVYIPKTVPAGSYEGTITILEDGEATREIPVELFVHDFTLPDLPNARTVLHYSSENINDRYLGTAYPEEGTALYEQSLVLADRHFQLAHRHKVSLSGSPGGYTPVERMDDAWGPRLSGELFTASQGYDGPGVGVGNNVYVIGEYGQWPWQEGSRDDMWANTDAWVEWFDARSFATPTEYFLYLIDESDDYSQIERWAQWIHENPGPGQRLMSMATLDLPTAARYTPSLDIPAAWARFGIAEEWESALDALLADPRKRAYLYNGGRPACGSFAIEDDGVALRVVAWAQYKKRIDRWFYWESTYYDNYQAGEGPTNVFQRAQTYGFLDHADPVLGETGWNYLNGDGVLFYPGTDTRYPADNYGVPGPFASLRLKLWRRGLQDVDYLAMAASVDPQRTAEIVQRTVPKVLWEYGVNDPDDPTWVMTDIGWSTDPDDWEAARLELARIITAGTRPPKLVDSDEPRVTVTFAPGEPIHLKCKAEEGETLWVLVQAPLLLPGIEFARPRDAYCQEQGRYLFPFNSDAESLYYARSFAGSRIDFGVIDFSGMGGEVVVGIQKGASPDHLEAVQTIRILQRDSEEPAIKGDFLSRR